MISYRMSIAPLKVQRMEPSSVGTAEAVPCQFCPWGPNMGRPLLGDLSWGWCQVLRVLAAVDSRESHEPMVGRFWICRSKGTCFRAISRKLANPGVFGSERQWNHVFWFNVMYLQLFRSFNPLSLMLILFIETKTLTMLRIPDLVKQKYEATHKEPMEKLEDQLQQETKVINALKSFNQGDTPSPSTSTATTASTATGAGRTMASPEWGASGPMNLNQRVSLPAVPIVEFDSSHEHLDFRLAFLIFLFPNMFRKYSKPLHPTKIQQDRSFYTFDSRAKDWDCVDQEWFFVAVEPFNSTGGTATWRAFRIQCWPVPGSELRSSPNQRLIQYQFRIYSTNFGSNLYRISSI